MRIYGLSAYQVGSISDDVPCSGGALWTFFDPPHGPTSQARKSMFIFFTPVGEAPYPDQRKEDWGCGFAGRRLFSS